MAKESDRIKRAREKLLARWDEEAKFIGSEAIDEIKEKIKNHTIVIRHCVHVSQIQTLKNRLDYLLKGKAFRYLQALV